MSLRPEDLRRPDGTWRVSDAELIQLGGPDTRLDDLIWTLHRYQATSVELAAGHPPVALVQGSRVPLGREPVAGGLALKMVMLALRPEPKRHTLLEQGQVEDVLEHPMGSYRLQARLQGNGVQVRLEPTVAPSGPALLVEEDPVTAVPFRNSQPSPVPPEPVVEEPVPPVPAPPEPAPVPAPLVSPVPQLMPLAPSTPSAPARLPRPTAPADTNDPYALLSCPSGAFQAALFSDSCTLFRAGTPIGRRSLPGRPAGGLKPFLDDTATLHLPTTEGWRRLGQQESLLPLGLRRVDVSSDGSRWLYCDEAESRGLLGGTTRLFQLTMAGADRQLVYFETRSAPEWAVSPRFEHMLVGENRRGKMALHLISVADESVQNEFELARPREMQVADSGLMLLEFGEPEAPEWVMCRNQSGRLQSTQWRPPAGTRKGWPLGEGAIAVTDTHVLRLTVEGRTQKSVRIGDRTSSPLWNVVPESHQGAQLLVWEEGRVLALSLWDTPTAVRPLLPLEELLTYLTQNNCAGAWLQAGGRWTLDSGQMWGEQVVMEPDIAAWVEAARRTSGPDAKEFRRRALHHEYAIALVDGERPGLRIRRVESGPESM